VRNFAKLTLGLALTLSVFSIGLGSVTTQSALADGTVAPTAAANPGNCAKLTATTSAGTTATTIATASVAASPTPADARPSGSIAINGAFALYPLAQVWGDEYGKKTGTKFDIQATGAGAGMTGVLSGAIDIGLLSREVLPAETSKGAVIFPAAIDTVLFTVNVQNPVLSVIQKKGLTCTQLQKIFTSGDKLTWGGLVGTDDKTPINVYTRADSSGAADQVAKYLGTVGQDSLKGVGVQGDAGLATAVTKDPSGIGYNNPAFAFDPSTGAVVDGLALIPLDLNGNGTIDPDEAIYDSKDSVNKAIVAKKYPSPPTRVLYLVTKGQPTGTIKDFILWTLTDGQQFVESAGFVKVDSELIQKAIDSLK
jgi:phosphate transport system substrate-binding protein